MNYLDKIINKAVSRKLLAFAVGTFLLFKGNLNSEDWTLITCVYIGGQSVVDLFKIKHGVST